ncbi:hypothetical protein MRB53_009828 [Persea americana]|uniref:Uncharacterized protein n=1 Tax=Persea americana TaxID=3435 RepID=A0ACC2LQ10_PERAE|nr:hypothetical protein MRB53_009828 [Persea americana]
MYSSTAPGSKLNTTIQLNRELVLLYNRSGGSACCCTIKVEVLAVIFAEQKTGEGDRKSPDLARRRQRSLSPSLQPCPSPEKETAAVTETLCFRAVP